MACFAPMGSARPTDDNCWCVPWQLPVLRRVLADSKSEWTLPGLHGDGVRRDSSGVSVLVGAGSSALSRTAQTHFAPTALGRSGIHLTFSFISCFTLCGFHSCLPPGLGDFPLLPPPLTSASYPHSPSSAQIPDFLFFSPLPTLKGSFLFSSLLSFPFSGLSPFKPFSFPP